MNDNRIIPADAVERLYITLCVDRSEGRGLTVSAVAIQTCMTLNTASSRLTELERAGVLKYRNTDNRWVSA